MMFSSKTVLVAAAMLAVTALGTADQAKAQGSRDGNGHYCLWYKMKAMSTGDEYWWGRWRRCLRGWDWD